MIFQTRLEIQRIKGMITAPAKYNTAPGMLTLENVSSLSTARYLFRKVQNVRPANLLDITVCDTFEALSFQFLMYYFSIQI